MYSCIIKIVNNIALPDLLNKMDFEAIPVHISVCFSKFINGCFSPVVQSIKYQLSIFFPLNRNKVFIQMIYCPIYCLIYQ